MSASSNWERAKFLNPQRNDWMKAAALTLSSVLLSASLSFSSLTACLSASFFSVSSMATARCSPRSRSSTAVRSVWADWASRWALRRWPSADAEPDGEKDTDHIQRQREERKAATLKVYMHKIWCIETFSSPEDLISADVCRHTVYVPPSPLECCWAQPPLPLVSARSGPAHSARFARAQWGRPYSFSPPLMMPVLHPFVPFGYKTIITSPSGFHPHCPRSFLSLLSQLTCRSLLSCSATLSVFCRAVRRLCVLLWEAAASWRLFLREEVFSWVKTHLLSFEQSLAQPLHLSLEQRHTGVSFCHLQL